MKINIKNFNEAKELTKNFGISGMPNFFGQLSSLGLTQTEIDFFCILLTFEEKIIETEYNNIFLVKRIDKVISKILKGDKHN